MSRWQLILAASLLAAGAVPAPAQVSHDPRTPAYLRPPVLSPYLGLALGRDPAVNYFLGVRSEMDRRLNERILANTLLDVERRYEQPRDGTSDLFPTLPGTGHPSAFMNYGSYFNMGRPAPRRGR